MQEKEELFSKLTSKFCLMQKDYSNLDNEIKKVVVLTVLNIQASKSRAESQITSHKLKIEGCRSRIVDMDLSSLPNLLEMRDV